MAKNIIFCADGTWNDPNQDENVDSSPDPTNVYKLFVNLDGAFSHESLVVANEQEMALVKDGVTLQVAKYIHGVGDSRNPIIKIMGGAFGAGIISRIVRGYTFISRNYEPGDNIVIVGFSRGAYTARALAGLIAAQGVLAPPLTVDKTLAYKRGAEAWYRYRKASTVGLGVFAHLLEMVTDLPGFMTAGALKESDLVPVEKILAVGVWDTVGSLGFPEYTHGERTDVFKFADNVLSPKVLHGFHAVALDEQRHDFAPTLWDPAPSVEQMVFPGAHGDVGGGYPMVNQESGLSDGPLKWMIERLNSVGVRFKDKPLYVIEPNPLGIGHKPWVHVPWTIPGIPLGPRTLGKGLLVHPSVAARKAGGKVVGEPGEAPGPYAPSNWP